jgi:hypothetical protein
MFQVLKRAGVVRVEAEGTTIGEYGATQVFALKRRIPEVRIEAGVRSSLCDRMFEEALRFAEGG